MPIYSATIAGKPIRGDASFPVLNPATGDEAGRAPQLGLTDLDAAVRAGNDAFAALSSRPNQALRDACAAVTARIDEHAEELARIITLEQGKPLNGFGSRWEVGGAVAWAKYTTELSLSARVLQEDATGRVVLQHKPLGVVGSITPWNFPVLIAVWHILPALRTGNTVVIKPSPLTPLSTLRLVEIMNEALPPGVLSIVTADDEACNLGAAMAAHDGIRKIVFTGSCATGQKVMQTAAATVKRLTLEMGGNDAGIVLPDADPGKIAEGLFWGAFINNGQTCAALKRLYVHDAIHDAVCEALVEYARKIRVGNGLEETSALGPVQNRRQFDKVSRLVADAKRRGRVLLGGEPGQGLFFPPTIIVGLSNGDALVDEEQFGPALPVIRYRDVEQAIALANDSPNGLGGSVWSPDVGAAEKVAARLACGSVWINKHGAIQPNIPFGGVKFSGLGVEFAEEGLREYTDIQVIFS